jgi:hypothetical protein
MENKETLPALPEEIGTKEKVLAFLNDTKTWDYNDRQKLVSLWNDLRGESPIGKINMTSVRSPCRLKDVRAALIKFVTDM